MTNKEIYSKTISFSVFRLLYDILAFAALAAMAIGGFFIAEMTINSGLIGLGIGALVGIIAVAIMLRYISYTFKAGQIAMMTEAITKSILNT
jgi:TRAP-type C4-dicarboxylate transport system permease small subunit